MGSPSSEHIITALYVDPGTPAWTQVTGGALADGIGNVYVDDEAEPPPYNALPAFWPAGVVMVVACDQLAPRLRRDR